MKRNLSRLAAFGIVLLAIGCGGATAPADRKNEPPKGEPPMPVGYMSPVDMSKMK